MSLRQGYERLRRLDRRIMESPVGWILPSGTSYKLGRRDPGPTDRRSVYWLGVLLQGPVRGLLSGWNYNVGRERTQREREQAAE